MTITSRPRTRGPLTLDEVRAVVGRYDHESTRLWSEAWNAANLVDAMCQADTARTILEGVSDAERVVLSEVASTGGRVRGDSVRRTLTLRGHDDASKAIRSLALRGLLIPIPEPNLPPVSIERISKRSAFLQSDFALTHIVASEIAADERIGAEVESRDDLEPEHAEQSKQFFLNLLVLHAALDNTPLQLTRMDLPSRRALPKVTCGLWVANPTHQGTFDAENLAHLDELSFAIGVLYALGGVDVEQSQVFAKPIQWDALDIDVLANAYTRTALWSESDREGQIRNTKSAFPAIRAYTWSVFNRIGTDAWISLDTLQRYCMTVDSVFFSRALQQSDISAKDFVASWVEAMLKVGALVSAIDEGKRFVKRRDDVDQPQPQKAFVVQPSGEVSAFFDPLTIETARGLLQVCDVEHRQERTLTLRITPDSAQRGFVGGHTDVSAIEFLNEFGVTPLPDTTTFQIQDWYRVHKQHSIFADGFLICCRDFDVLDLAVGQLKHDWPTAELQRLTGDIVLVSGVSETDFSKLWREYLVVEPESTEPCLRFTAKHVADYDPFRSSVSAHDVILEIAEIQKGAKFDRVTFDMEKVESKWGAMAFESFVEFLEPLVDGEIPADQLVAFRHDLVGSETIKIRSDVVVLSVPDPLLADALARLPEAADSIVSRLGPTAFEVSREKIDDIVAALAALDIKVEHG